MDGAGRAGQAFAVHALTCDVQGKRSVSRSTQASDTRPCPFKNSPLNIVRTVQG